MSQYIIKSNGKHYDSDQNQGPSEKDKNKHMRVHTEVVEVQVQSSVLYRHEVLGRCTGWT